MSSQSPMKVNKISGTPTMFATEQFKRGGRMCEYRRESPKPGEGMFLKVGKCTLDQLELHIHFFV